MASRVTRAASVGAWLLCLAALIALAIAAVNAFNEGNGIAFTPGAYLVLVSSALLLIGALVLALGSRLPRWVTTVFVILVLLDILGTALAAYMLQANLLVAAMGLAGIAWLIHLVRDHRARNPSGHPGTRASAEQGT